MKSLEIKPYRLRVFDPERDYETLCDWWVSHGAENPPQRAFLPKLGVIAIEDDGASAAMGFVYMDNSVGVCFFEFPVSRPGLDLAHSREAFKSIAGFLKMRTAELGYHVMFGYTPKALARWARSYGFQSSRNGLVMVYSELKGGE